MRYRTAQTHTRDLLLTDDIRLSPVDAEQSLHHQRWLHAAVPWVMLAALPWMLGVRKLR